jgi:hypothetical protein
MSVIPTAKMWNQFMRSVIVQEHQKLSLTCVAGLHANFLLIKIDNTTFWGLSAHHEVGIDEMN